MSAKQNTDPVLALLDQFNALPQARQHDAIGLLHAAYKTNYRRAETIRLVNADFKIGEIVTFTKGKGWNAEVKYMRIESFKRDSSGVKGPETDEHGEVLTPRTNWTVGANLISRVATA